MRVRLPDVVPMDILDGVREAQMHLEPAERLGAQVLELEMHDRRHATVKVILPGAIQHITMDTEIGML